MFYGLYFLLVVDILKGSTYLSAYRISFLSTRLGIGRSDLVAREHTSMGEESMVVQINDSAVQSIVCNRI